MGRIERDRTGAGSMKTGYKTRVRPRPTVYSLVLMLVTIVAGLAIRFVHLGLPRSVVKYGGSMLWAVMIYWMVSTILAGWRMRWVAIVSGLIATAVEFVKLYHTAWLDAFRHTLPGIVLLGSIFSFRDIAAYWIAIVLAAVLDSSIRRTRLIPVRKSG